VKTYTLKNGLVAQVEPIEPWVVQDHLFRHAFGVEKAKAWDCEGFTELGLTAEVRDAAFRAVRKLYDRGRGCGFGAVHGRPPPKDGDSRPPHPCGTCPAPVREGCVDATAAARGRYLGLFESLVAELASDEAAVLTTVDFARHSLACLRKPRKVEGLVVGRLGWSTTRKEPVFRIVRSDGLRVDLYYRATLTFRTLFRDAQEASRGPLQVLQKGVVPIPGEILSERAVVSRPFWEGP
jgi:hypothetical protein